MLCDFSKMRLIKMKYFSITVLLLSVYLFIFYLLMDAWYSYKIAPSHMTTLVLPYIVVHIDLKGGPPKLEYLQSILPMLKDHGVNGLLMEYENMFPYEGKLVNLSAATCYKKSELQEFLINAVNSGFEIIPLIQTFGHLEFALKLQEFQHLRELPLYPDSICPSKDESHTFIKEMLNQVIMFHNNISLLKYIHIGCDEVFHMNKCNRCIERNLSNYVVFATHIKAVTKVIRDLCPDTTVLIWDDMLRTIKPAHWNIIDEYKNIEPVYWDYGPSLRVTHINLLKYHRKFENIWIASAFKGADGRVVTIPNLRNRFRNHFSWMDLIVDYKFGGESQFYSFNGIILTGWSRYSHMDPPCELFPVAIPSLILNLLLIKRFQTEMVITNIENSFSFEEFFIDFLHSELYKSLQCDEIGVNANEYCTFDGHDLYRVMKEHILLDKYVQDSFNNDSSELRSVEYYSKQNYVNMNSVVRNIKWCKETIDKVLDFEKKLHHIMLQYYRCDFIEEYVNFKTYDSKRKLYDMLKILNGFMKNNTLESRPTEYIFVVFN